MEAWPGCNWLAPMNSTDQNCYMRMQCSDEYYGPACSLCLRNSTHSYGRTFGLNCQSCRDAALIVLAYAGSTVMVVLYLSFTVHFTLKETSREIDDSDDVLKASELLRVSHQSCTSLACGWAPLLLLTHGAAS